MKGKYYIFLCDVFTNFKYFYSETKESMFEYCKGYFPNIDKEEFELSFMWAIADTFNDGCEAERI
jgi:hypothetical protein